MALSTPSVLITHTASLASTSETTASISPSANALLLVVVSVTVAAESPSISSITSTLSGLGTWTAIGETWHDAANNSFVAAWRCKCGATPGSGTVTVNASVSFNRWVVSVIEITGENTTTPVANFKSGTGTSATPSLTLDSTPAADSCVIGVLTSQGDTNGVTEGGAYVELIDISSGGGATARQHVEYDLSPGSTTVDWSAAATTSNSFIAFEVQAAGGGGTEYNQSAAGTLTNAGTVTKATAKTFTGTLTSAGALLKATGKTVVGTLTSSGALTTVRSYVRAFGGTLTSAGTLTKNVGKSAAGALTSEGALVTSRTFLAVLEGTLTSAGTLAKTTGKLATGTLTSAGSLSRSISVFVAGTLTSAGTLAKNTGKAVAGALTSSGALVTANAYMISLAGTLTSSGALSKATGKALAGTLTSAGTINKAISKFVSGVLSSIGTLLGVLVGSSVPKLDVALSDSAVYVALATDAALTTVTLSDSDVTGVSLGDTSRG